MSDEKDDEGFTLIPSWEWGPGSRLDIETNTLYGVSGAVYRNVQIDAAALQRAFKSKRH